MELHPGDRIDRYVLLELLGRGGQGAVYKAEDALFPGELRAVKIVDLTQTRADDVERVRREARALARLEHPSLVACHASFEDLKRSVLGVSMDYVDGVSLRRVADDPRLAAAHKLLVLKHLARVLAYVHQRGVVHRDLKLDNVLVTQAFFQQPQEPKNVKLVDFGIAKVAGAGQALTQIDTLIGTLAYLCPEQLDPRQFGPDKPSAADVFAYGVMAYKLLLGEHPTGLSANATVADYITAYRRAAEREWPATRLDGTWGKLLVDCLALRVRDRIADGTELWRRCEALEGVAVVVRPAVIGHELRPTSVDSPAAMRGDTVDMGPLERHEAPTYRDPNLVVVPVAPRAAEPLSDAAPPHASLASAASPPSAKRVTSWPIALTALALLAAAVVSFIVLQRPRAEMPPPLPRLGLGAASGGPLELVPEPAPGLDPMMLPPTCSLDAGLCACCAAGRNCGGPCSEPLPEQDYELVARAVVPAFGSQLGEGAELCMQRVGIAASEVCVPVAKLSKGGSDHLTDLSDAAAPLLVAPHELAETGVTVALYNRGRDASPVPLTRGTLRQPLLRRHLCTGLWVDEWEEPIVKRVFLLLSEPGRAPDAQCSIDAGGK